jgi:hypothetical protein
MRRRRRLFGVTCWPLLAMALAITGPALAQKPGGILKLYNIDSPASMSDGPRSRRGDCAGLYHHDRRSAALSSSIWLVCQRMLDQTLHCATQICSLYSHGSCHCAGAVETEARLMIFLSPVRSGISRRSPRPA